MIYLVGYDLKKPGQDYTQLFDAIKAIGAWWHNLDSTWLLQTSLSATDLFERLRGTIDRSDRMLIISVGRDYSGWLSQDAWTWIKERI